MTKDKMVVELLIYAKSAIIFFDQSETFLDSTIPIHSVIFPKGVVHRVENKWGLTKVL